MCDNKRIKSCLVLLGIVTCILKPGSCSVWWLSLCFIAVPVPVRSAAVESSDHPWPRALHLAQLQGKKLRPWLQRPWKRHTGISAAPACAVPWVWPFSTYFHCYIQCSLRQKGREKKHCQLSRYRLLLYQTECLTHFSFLFPPHTCCVWADTANLFQCCWICFKSVPLLNNSV